MRKPLLLLFVLIGISLSASAQCTSAPGQPGPITGNDPVCPGSTQTYFINAIAGATSYTWTLPSGWTGFSTSNNIVVTVGSTPGSISVFGSNDCGDGPSQVYMATIFNASASAAGATTFCEGNAVALNASSGTGYTYQWYEGANPIAGANAASYSATESGTYTAHVSINGCDVTTDPISVTVNPTPVAPVAGSNSPICEGSTLGLTSYSTTPGASYNWTGPNNFSTQNPAVPGALVSDGGVYTVTASLNGCTSTPVTVMATILDAAPAQPGPIAGPIALCEGSNETYTISPVTNASNYNWTFPTSWVTGTNNTTSATAIAGPNSGNIIVTASNVCGIGPAQILPVTVVATPLANAYAAGTTTLCQGESLDLYAVTGTGLSYQWEEGNNAIAGATGFNHIVSTSGSYTVTVSNGTCEATSAPINVVVNPLPAPVVVQAGNTLSTGSFSTYQWYMNGIPIIGATLQDYTPTQDGDYYVVVTDNNSCVGQSNSIQVIIPVSVKEVTANGQIGLYPNPNDGRFTIHGLFENDGSVYAEVIDATGRLILSEQWKVTDSQIDRQVKMSTDLPSGVYTLKLTSGSSNTAMKFLKK